MNCIHIFLFLGILKNSFVTTDIVTFDKISKKAYYSHLTIFTPVYLTMPLIVNRTNDDLSAELDYLKREKKKDNYERP